MTLTITQQLDNFVAAYVEQANGNALHIPFDPSWPSVCYQTQGESGELVKWLPVKQDTPLSFDNVEEAMSIKLDAQYCVFFTRYFSHNLTAKASQGKCELLQVWNVDDFERLQQNLIGHLLMKQRLHQSATLFFGLTDEDDFILTIINETGEVALEQVGKEPTQILAPSLADFLEQLSPCTQ